MHRHCEFLAGGMAELGQTCRISRHLFCRPGRRRDNKMYEGSGAQTDMEGQGKHSGCALLGWESWSRPRRGLQATGLLSVLRNQDSSWQLSGTLFSQLCHGSFAFLLIHSPGRAGQGLAEAKAVRLAAELCVLGGGGLGRVRGHRL